MLNRTRVTAMLPVKDLARARSFYEKQLGLEPAGLKPDGKFVYLCGGTELALFPRPGGTKAEHTAISFKVADIASAVRELEGRGVQFADYDLPGLKTVEHAFRLCGGMFVAMPTAMPPEPFTSRFGSREGMTTLSPGTWVKNASTD